MAWQATKTLIGAILLSNAIFGMGVIAALSGLDFGLTNIPRVMSLSFIPASINDIAPAMTVISSIPALTILLPPLLSAFGLRLILLVGLTMLVKAASESIMNYLKTGIIRIPVEVIETLIAIGVAWTGFNLFFPNYINYNTKIFIIGAFIISAIMLLFVYLDRTKTGFIYAYTIKAGAIILILLAVFAIASIQNSIADARRVEWLGPYVKQEIAVNRYLADIDDVKIFIYNFTAKSNVLNSSQLSRIHRDLQTVRLWDWDAAFTKLKPEIGLIPYIDFEDSDILRFRNRLYWSASMKPVLPRGIPPSDIWYNEHLVYTHVPSGFLLLDANNGTVINPSTFFKQRRIYYGEGGLFDTTWAAIILGKERSDEVTGVGYHGNGGVIISPPTTWLFDVTFLLSYPDKHVRVIRYRDVYDRMELILPYFTYIWRGRYVDMFPVTDGNRTYWLMPLIIRLGTSMVPWSKDHELVRFIGYSLIDVYDGEIKLLIIGDDFVSELIRRAYPDLLIEEFPDWLKHQTRFPEEVFEYQVEMFNTYHVEDPATFIQAREFYEIPKGVHVYYIIAQPPRFERPEFIGLLSLQLRGSPGRNLAGFMVVRNDYPNLGEKIFYRVPIGSEVKLLGPSAAREALERFAEFRKLRTLLENPRIGETILYQIGDYLVYVIPVYTSPAGGVVAQLGTIATVGAEFTGKYFIGLGSTPEESFNSFLRSLGGAAPTITGIDLYNLTMSILRDFKLRIMYPEKINADLIFLEGNITYRSLKLLREDLSKFISTWVTGRGLDRVLVWRLNNTVNVGSIFSEEGVVELHYIRIVGG
ncbi:MAG: hypothetical protein B6U65_02660 [Candidatus Wolframiiraptor sp. EX4484-121]|nr:MAG: hypothetical protein B6U65_02660 [Candidatus Wolframiiraptor sp. EX4484-121]